MKCSSVEDIEKLTVSAGERASVQQKVFSQHLQLQNTPGTLSSQSIDRGKQIKCMRIRLDNL